MISSNSRDTLKLEYSLLHNQLIIADSEKMCTKLTLSIKQSIELVSLLRTMVLDATNLFNVTIGNYSISAVCLEDEKPAGDILISIMLEVGGRSKPVFTGEFSGYYGKSSMLEGLSFAKKKIKELCD